MCGIWGMIADGDIDRALFEKAGDALSHRGPDDSGIYLKSGVRGQGSGVNAALGHRRLSIIDLSENAHQPMSNENGSLWITYNGEIYNFQEIRKALTAAGHRFKSNSDTEVILHAYEEWEEKCLEKFQGMFAFAIWDGKRQRLFIARDRIGKKPLFYYYDGKTFAFASELQGLMALNIPRNVNLSAINFFLTYQYIPAPKSAFKNIFKLPPAHYLILECGDNPHSILRIQKYWDIDFSKKIVTTDERGLAVEVFQRLDKAVEKRLISDVPLGAFLSGGIDSSIVTALMSGLMKEPVKTFSIGFEDDTYNELPYARQIAKLFKTDHKEFIVKFDALNVLPKLVRHYGEPFADSSALPTYYLSKMTSEFVKVALSGDGGDENFAGYDRYYALKLMQWFRHMPESVRALCVKILNIGGESDIKSKKKRLKRFVQGSFNPSNQEYLQWMIAFSKNDMQDYYGDAMQESLKNEEPHDYLIKLFERSTANNMVEKAMDADIHSYLPFDLLVKVDIASMANSLEVRGPFLDYEFMEFAASIPAEYKLRGRINKYILKKAFNGVIPKAVFSRQKAGFGVPISKWFRNELKDYLTETLLSQKSLQRGYFKPDAVTKLISEHTCGRLDNSAKLWALLMLELWHREFADV
ncbi:MAG: asparagine synthase (glutamine-hydrolyzing) [Nitrospirae bacterium]|nr:asparagine synthase (glutamine-hydrolyzing) [Nitrospirota bacterium]